MCVCVCARARAVAAVHTCRTEKGDTPLIAASRNAHLDVARLLLRHGADINQGSATSGATALYIASQNGHVAVAQLLLDSKADPNKATTDEHGDTALYMASQNGHAKASATRLLRHICPVSDSPHSLCMAPTYLSPMNVTHVYRKRTAMWIAVAF